MAGNDSAAIKNHAAFIWSVADLLRGDYKQSEYGKVILPLTVIRRLDCVLEPTKAKVLAIHRQFGDRYPLLRSAADDNQFYNTSVLTLRRIRTWPRPQPARCSTRRSSPSSTWMTWMTW